MIVYRVEHTTAVDDRTRHVVFKYRVATLVNAKEDVRD